MQITPYLNFNGQCKEAFTLYAECFGGEIVQIMTHGEAPIGDMPAPEHPDWILNATLVIKGLVIMGCDAPNGMYSEPKGIWVNTMLEDPIEAERIFNVLKDDGNIVMPYEETFWAKGFGMVVDRFGTPWMINCAKPA